MRFEINLELKKAELELDYRRGFISFFKAILDNYNEDLKNILYEKGNSKKFTFSVYMKIEKIGKEIIYLKDNHIKISLSVGEQMLSLHFFQALLESRLKEINMGKDNIIKILSVTKGKEKEIEDNIVLFKTLSPLVIREHKKENDWYHDFDEKGIEILKKNIEFNLKDKFPENLLKEIEINAIEIKRTVVLFYGIKFPVTTGIIEIKANKKILSYFYKNGFGSKSSAGFGMLEIV